MHEWAKKGGFFPFSKNFTKNDFFGKSGQKIEK
jgi:hypothetical protein